MSFNALARGLAVTLAGVFGEAYRLQRPGSWWQDDVPVVVRRNAEAMDGNGQVVTIEYLARIAKATVERQPQRGDELRRGMERYVLGRCLTDNESVWEFEVSKC